jgi:hypothetical protein
MTVEYTIISNEGWGGINVLVVLVKPVVCLKMPKGNPVFLSLQSWIMCYSFLDTMLMVALEANVGWSFTLMVSELPSHTFHSIVVVVNVSLI